MFTHNFIRCDRRCWAADKTAHDKTNNITIAPNAPRTFSRIHTEFIRAKSCLQAKSQEDNFKNDDLPYTLHSFFSQLLIQYNLILKIRMFRHYQTRAFAMSANIHFHFIYTIPANAVLLLSQSCQYTKGTYITIQIDTCTSSFVFASGDASMVFLLIARIDRSVHELCMGCWTKLPKRTNNRGLKSHNNRQSWRALNSKINVVSLDGICTFNAIENKSSFLAGSLTPSPVQTQFQQYRIAWASSMCARHVCVSAVECLYDNEIVNCH